VFEIIISGMMILCRDFVNGQFWRSLDGWVLGPHRFWTLCNCWDMEKLLFLLVFDVWLQGRRLKACTTADGLLRCWAGWSSYHTVLVLLRTVLMLGSPPRNE